MKKCILILLGIFLTASFMSALEKTDLEKSNGKITFQLEEYSFQNLTPAQEAQPYAASSGGGGSSALIMESLGLSLAIGGFLMVCGGIPMVYINAVGLGYTTSDSFDVYYFDNNTDFGRAALWGGVALIITGSIFMIAGIPIAAIGFALSAGTGGRANLFFENGSSVKTAALGISLKL